MTLLSDIVKDLEKRSNYIHGSIERKDDKLTDMVRGSKVSGLSIEEIRNEKNQTQDIKDIIELYDNIEKMELEGEKIDQSIKLLKEVK